MTQESQLTETQKRLLRTFLAQAGASVIDRKFDLIRRGHRKYARLNEVEIAINLPDQEMMSLARLGYLQIYTNPPALVFTKKILAESKEGEQEAELHSSKRLDPNPQVVRMDIVQVYAWLAASLLAAVFSLYLLWSTVQQAVSNNITESIFRAIIMAITGLLSGIFFRNYDKANERVKYLRSTSYDAVDEKVEK